MSFTEYGIVDGGIFVEVMTGNLVKTYLSTNLDKALSWVAKSIDFVEEVKRVD